MGSIGVRCSRDPGNLWFHLEVAIAYDFLHPPFRTDGSDKVNNTLLQIRHPWEHLTFIGSRIVIRVLAIPGTKSLSARPKYFDLEVAHKDAWRDILPRAVEIIRHETNDPHAAVVIKHGDDTTPIPQWHEPLLRELFE